VGLAAQLLSVQILTKEYLLVARNNGETQAQSTSSSGSPGPRDPQLGLQLERPEGPAAGG